MTDERIVTELREAESRLAEHIGVTEGRPAIFRYLLAFEVEDEVTEAWSEAYSWYVSMAEGDNYWERPLVCKHCGKGLYVTDMEDVNSRVWLFPRGKFRHVDDDAWVCRTQPPHHAEPMEKHAR